MQEKTEQSQESICNDSKYFFSVIICYIIILLVLACFWQQILCREAEKHYMAMFILNIEKNLLGLSMYQSMFCNKMKNFRNIFKA